MQRKSCSETSSKAKRSRTYGKALAIGGASVRCVLLAPFVVAVAGCDAVGTTGVAFFAGADFAVAVFAILGTDLSSESSASVMSTAKAADVLLDDAPPALLFLDVEAAATSWSSSASLIWTSTTESGKPLLSMRVLSVGSRMFFTAVTTRSFVSGRKSTCLPSHVHVHVRRMARLQTAVSLGPCRADKNVQHDP